MELHYWRGRKNVALSRHQRETLIFIIIFPYINMPTPVLWIIKVTVKEKVGSTLYLSCINSRNSFFSAGRAGVQGREDAPGDPRGH